MFLVVEFDPEGGMTEEELNDYFTGDVQCAWCDDGGRLIMCDGPCMRGFHMGNPLYPQPSITSSSRARL